MGLRAPKGEPSVRILTISHLYPSEVDDTAGTFVHQQVCALRERGHDVRVISPVAWAPPGVPRYAAHRAVPRCTRIDDVPVLHPRMFVLPGARLGPGIVHSTLRAIIGHVRRTYRDWPFDLVHAHMLVPDGWAAASAGHAVGVPVVATAHGSADVLQTPGRSAAWRRTVIESITELDQIIAVSHAVAHGVCDLARPRHGVRVIPNGADPTHFAAVDRAAARRSLGLPTDRPVALFVGHLTELKGIADVVDAVANGDPELRPLLAIVGEGPMRPALEERVANLGLGDSVRFAGRVPHDDVGRWMGACDVLVLPSLSEGLPTVICEAMLVGRAVIATRVGGTPELVEDGATGILVAPGNVPALAEALRGLLGTPGRAEAMGELAAVRARDTLTWAAVAQQIEAVYREVLVRQHTTMPDADPAGDNIPHIAIP
jgi:teichuronic acid biosynthesis glycosyltransferase TuaC